MKNRFKQLLNYGKSHTLPGDLPRSCVEYTKEGYLMFLKSINYNFGIKIDANYKITGYPIIFRVNAKNMVAQAKRYEGETYPDEYFAD